ncbi:MAG TPA: DsbA family protein [Ruania sp.]|nr:DsbA family protein [Ruania sp.]
MLTVDVWADVRCPWCWIGLRRLQRVCDMIDEPVRVRRRSFLLEPQGPASPGRPTAQVATTEWGMSREEWNSRRQTIEVEARSEGLHIRMDGALMFDSSPLQRLLKLATVAMDYDHAQHAWESAFAAHFERNEDLGDPDVLHQLASQWGLEEAEVQRALLGELFTDEIADDLREARRLSVTSVPTVIAADGRRTRGHAPTVELAQFLRAGAL